MQLRVGTRSQIQLPSPSRYLPQGQSRHCTLSCAQIRNPNPNPFSINDAQTDETDERPPSPTIPVPVLRSQLCAVCGFHCGPFGARALGSLSAIAAAYDSSVLPPFCWLALAARTRRGFVALFRLFPFVVFELSALLVWHPLHTDTHTHTLKLAHTHTRTHAELLTNSAIDWPRFMASIMKSCSSNCDKFDAKKKATTKCQNHLQVNLSSKENT